MDIEPAAPPSLRRGITFGLILSAPYWVAPLALSWAFDLSFWASLLWAAGGYTALLGIPLLFSVLRAGARADRP